MKNLRSGKIYTIGLLSLFLSGYFCLAAQASVAGFSLGDGRFSKEVKSLKDIRTANIVTQSLDYSCGPAVIATIMTYYFGEKVSEKDVLSYLLLTTDLAKVKKNKGFSLFDLKNFARSRNYQAVGYSMDLEFLSQIDKPVLVPIAIRDYNHFVVFRGLKAGRVFLADPVLGAMSMRAEKFLKIWKGGIGLVLSKEGKENPGSALMVSGKEVSLFDSGAYAQRVLGENALGRIFADGEF